MEGALLIVVVAGTVVCSVIAIFTLAQSGKTYGQIGSGGISTDDPDSATVRSPAAPVVGDERDEEIRQLFEARNARRARRGEAPLDVEAELAALSGKIVDRARTGKQPLDVETEIDRQLRELT